MARLLYLLLLVFTSLTNARPTDLSFPVSPHTRNPSNLTLISRSGLHPRTGRSEKFMTRFVKGAEAWTDFQQKLHDRSGTSTNTISLEYDDHTKGWECGERVPVDQDGWRYEPEDPEEGSPQLEAVYKAINLEGKVQLNGLIATLWRDPEVVVSIYYDCDNGIMVQDLAYLRYKDDQGQKHHIDDSWSDVAWSLYEIGCPASVQKLQYLIVELVKNPTTRSILEEATAAAGHWDEKNAKANNFVPTTWDPSTITQPITEGSCSPESGSCDFYSVLSTPNTIGSVHLLEDHMSKLNYKTIESISGFHDCVYQNAEGTAFVKWTLYVKFSGS
ncbi:uncharacterized protein N7459_006559 [Penicillium hispanicum]|uniref:uncharacterized protein n=1 Tax=Penicillium hispanicum TaxID=1080232 RepID=UPI0025420158|nr:uncharacterized protein N7459_006559 [Penicillium hispanicum]KAJ5577595.1 hypothetical protein N7459_006559 [Penicillium hispanicum]